jgi:hypothetical protein
VRWRSGVSCVWESSGVGTDHRDCGGVCACTKTPHWLCLESMRRCSDVAGELFFLGEVFGHDSGDHDVPVLSSIQMPEPARVWLERSVEGETGPSCDGQGSPDCHWCMHVCGVS